MTSTHATSKTRLEAFSDGVIAINLTALALSHSFTCVPLALYVAVELLWLVPDRRIERAMQGAS